MEKVKNVKGVDGTINLTGEYGAPAVMFNVGDAEFWENIEQGILPLVKTLVGNGVETFGSCQGHVSASGDTLLANVRVYVDSYRIGRILSYSVDKFNDPMVVLEFSEDVEGVYGPRRTQRIVFLVEPNNREELDSLIVRYSDFLNDVLASRRVF